MSVRVYPITIAETASFDRSVKKLLLEDERRALIEYLAYNPTVGDVIQDTRGIRKARYGLVGKGKSGGIRVLYLFHDLSMPLYLLMAYPKSQKIDVTADEKKVLRDLVKTLVQQHKSKERDR